MNRHERRALVRQARRAATEIPGTAADLRRRAIARRGDHVRVVCAGWIVTLSVDFLYRELEDPAAHAAAVAMLRDLYSAHARIRVRVESCIASRPCAHTHWHLACSLAPRDRVHVAQDWQNLGRLVRAVGAPPEAIAAADVGTVRTPEAVHHYIWTEAQGALSR